MVSDLNDKAHELTLRVERVSCRKAARLSSSRPIGLLLRDAEDDVAALLGLLAELGWSRGSEGIVSSLQLDNRPPVLGRCLALGDEPGAVCGQPTTGGSRCFDCIARREAA